MKDTITKYTYKVKAAIALAVSLNVLTAAEIGRQGVNANTLYTKLHELGYLWDQPKQKWRKRLYGNGKAVYPASELPVETVQVHGALRVVKITFHAPHELVLRTTQDFRIFCDLAGINIAEETSPRGFKSNPDWLVWQLVLEYPVEKGR